MIKQINLYKDLLASMTNNSLTKKMVVSFQGRDKYNIDLIHEQWSYQFSIYKTKSHDLVSFGEHKTKKDLIKEISKKMKNLWFKEKNEPLPLMPSLELNDELIDEKDINKRVDNLKVDKDTRVIIKRRVGKFLEEMAVIKTRVNKLAHINPHDLTDATYQVVLQVEKCDYTIEWKTYKIEAFEEIKNLTSTEYKKFNKKLELRSFEYFKDFILKETTYAFINKDITEIGFTFKIWLWFLDWTIIPEYHEEESIHIKKDY